MSQTPQGGLIFVLVGPSGVGKNTIMCRALDQVSNLRQLPTATTRARRDNEMEGREHYFHTKESFDQLIENDALLEWQWVHDNRYGIVRETIDTAIAAQQDLVADIEVLGASILGNTYPDNAILVFVSPPHLSILEDRIRNRGADSEDEITRRLQRVSFEMKYAGICDYLIVNDDLDRATEEFLSVVFSERSRRNIRSTLAVARIRWQDRILCHTACELPTINVAAGEKGDQAIYRLLNQLGLSDVSLTRHPQAPEDGIAPTRVEIANSEHQISVVLYFDCVIDTTEIPPEVPSGWSWQLEAELNR